MNRGRTRNAGGNYRPRGRSSRSGGAGDSAHPHGSVGADRSSDDVSLGQKDNLSHIGRQTSGRQRSRGSYQKQFDHTSASDYPFQQQRPLSGVKDVSSGMENLELVQNSPEDVAFISERLESVSAPGSKSKMDFPSLSARIDPKGKHLDVRNTQKGQTSDVRAETSHLDCCSTFVENACMQSKSSPLADSGIKEAPSKEGTQCSQTSHEKTSSSRRSEDSACMPVGVPFDICPESPANLVRLKAPLLVRNREKRNELKRSMEEQNIKILRPGMILIKNFISYINQVNIIKTCWKLGKGSGGFYEPGYRDGAKLHLKMMCLGMNWDPETSKYGVQRPIDDAKPPDIPNEFHQLINVAIQESHALLKKLKKARNVEDILPSMSPNICIVNFYSKSGRLGLHQDKDESSESLDRGLPVVSFSIGDSAEFLFGDQWDIDKAEKVILESGDVLIFGGKSRHIFHGVTAILPDTAPKSLLEETNFRPGRLNLTFREY